MAKRRERTPGGIAPLCAKVFRAMRLGVYIQVPFCQTKCTYCNFHTGVVSADRFRPYVEAVRSEIRSHQRWYAASGIKLHDSFAGAVVDTVYVGGGTPSLLAPADLAIFIASVREGFSVELSEVTLEADPETIDGEKAVAWLEAGFNRISLGAQSFSDRELVATGRMHRRADIPRAVGALRGAGFQNLSLDLIAGLPHQTEESWRNSVKELLALEPEHISIYMLEVDDESRLGGEILHGGSRYGAQGVPADDLIAEFYEYACEALLAAGYHHYEISNWAKPGFESRHNLKYWRREPYLGFGAGAHSFSGTERWASVHDAAGYVRAIEAGQVPIEQHEVVTAEQALEEELFLGLRQLDGIDLSGLEARYGVPLASRFDVLALNGLVERNGSVVRLAPSRLSVSNEVFVELLR
jgi:oxygen-independent coproporphyrinogen-3 oxidase